MLGETYVVWNLKKKLKYFLLKVCLAFSGFIFGLTRMGLAPGVSSQTMWFPTYFQKIF
jgi:hypothetical protein